MQEQWLETGMAIRFAATDETEGIDVGQTVINLAFIERIEFGSTTASNETWIQAKLYRPGEKEPAYSLGRTDSRSLANRLRQALPSVPLDRMRRRRADPFKNMSRKPEENRVLTTQQNAVEEPT